jgi:hypothetical protein
MERQSLNQEEQIERLLHSSVNVFRTNKNLSIGQERQSIKKRSSSMLLSKNFVPKLKPIKAIITPSPINLNQKPPGPVPELQKKTISTESIDSQDDSNLKSIKYIYSRRNQKQSSKINNIEEETNEVSDLENNIKKNPKIHSDLDLLKSEDDEFDNNKNKNKNKLNKKKFENFLENINIIRKNMSKIKKKFISNKDNLYDDSNIDNNFVRKRLNHFKDNEQENYINKIRKKKFLNLSFIKKIKYRTKSFNIKQRNVSTIIDFLEKKNRNNSLNPNKK